MRRGVVALLVALAALPSRGDAQAAETNRVPCARAVADGARVRVSPVNASRVTGTALGWTSSGPRLVSSRGDTIALHPDDRLEESLGRTGRRTWHGAIIGALAAGAALAVSCGGRQYCGEENPLPLLGAAAGALVGHRMKRERWRQIPSDSTCAEPLPAK